MSEPMNEKSVWIVEDDPFYTPALCKILANAGYDPVEHIKTGQEAIQRWRGAALKPSVIILDMMLRFDEDDTTGQFQPGPGEIATGAQVAEELVKLGVNAKQIVVITALHKEVFHQPIHKLGIRLLLKPARVAEILAAVKRAADSQP